MTLGQIGSLLAVVLALLGIINQLVSIGKSVGELIGKIDGYEKLTSFKIEELSKKQDKHNNLIERVAVLEHSGAERRKDTENIFERLREGKL